MAINNDFVLLLEQLSNPGNDIRRDAEERYKYLQNFRLYFLLSSLLEVS